MGTLTAALYSAGDALRVFQTAMGVSENNVVNASTSGYVEQTQQLEAMAFDAKAGIVGGVSAGPVTSARNIYSEQQVQREVTSLGQWEQQATTLSPVQGTFDTTGKSGIPGALNQLFQSFSAWSTTPNDGIAQQNVLNAAQSVAQSFQQQNKELVQAQTDAGTQLNNLVGQVNTLTQQLQQDNLKRAGNSQDPGLDANVYSTLEQLSELVPITALKQQDGSMTVLLAGQTPLVAGQFQYNIRAATANPASGQPSGQVFDANNQDITSAITQGQVGGLLNARSTIASLIGDAANPGLNQLASAIADRVNGLLTSGQTSDGTAGVPIFKYDPANPAGTLQVDSTVTPDQLAPVDPISQVSNGIALQLANLASPQNAADELNGLSYTQFYGNIAATVGTAVSTAQSNQSTQQGIVTQVRDLRQQSSGVSLDEEAIKMLQFQQSYTAAAKMVSIIDQLYQAVVNMVQ